MFICINIENNKENNIFFFLLLKFQFQKIHFYRMTLQMLRSIDAQIHRCLNTQMLRQIHRCLDRYINAQIHRCLNTQMLRQMHKCLDPQMLKYIDAQIDTQSARQDLYAMFNGIHSIILIQISGFCVIGIKILMQVLFNGDYGIGQVLSLCFC